jgi:hypothetical protein
VSGWEAAFKPAVRIPETQRNIRFPAIEADDLEVRRDIDIEQWKLGSECRERCDEHALRQAGWRIERAGKRAKTLEYQAMVHQLILPRKI